MLLSDFAAEMIALPTMMESRSSNPGGYRLPLLTSHFLIHSHQKQNLFCRRISTGRKRFSLPMQWVLLAFQHYSTSCLLRFFEFTRLVVGYEVFQISYSGFADASGNGNFSKGQVCGFEELDGSFLWFQPFDGQLLCTCCPRGLSPHREKHWKQSEYGRDGIIALLTNWKLRVEILVGKGGCLFEHVWMMWKGGSFWAVPCL